MNPKPIYEESLIKYWFGLSYAHWLTLPRVLMENMPNDWQRDMVRLLNELNNRFDWYPDDTVFIVSMKSKNKFVRLPENLCNYWHPNHDFLKTIMRKK